MESKTVHPITIAGPGPPDLEGLIDDDIKKRFENSSVFYGDIINAQLIKTLKELIYTLKQKS